MRIASVTLLFVASLSVSGAAGQTTFPDVAAVPVSGLVSLERVQ